MHSNTIVTEWMRKLAYVRAPHFWKGGRGDLNRQKTFPWSKGTRLHKGEPETHCYLNPPPPTTQMAPTPSPAHLLQAAPLRAASAARVSPHAPPTKASSPHGAAFAWLCNKGCSNRDVLPRVSDFGASSYSGFLTVARIAEPCQKNLCETPTPREHNGHKVQIRLYLRQNTLQQPPPSYPHRWVRAAKLRGHLCAVSYGYELRGNNKQTGTVCSLFSAIHLGL